jgi:large subunit ribosomal protein L6
MSRIGKSPITIPAGVTVSKSENTVAVKGPKGELKLVLPHGIEATVAGQTVTVENKSTNQTMRAQHGTTRALMQNMVTGVSTGWSKTLELVGVGYRAAMSGKNLTMTVGFSHPVTITPPEGITLSVVEGKVIVSGIDRASVGQIAADIRAVKPPEPYKGKGIRYSGEYIRRKAGKSAKAVGGAK